MAKGKKKGPPYDEDPDGEYIVIASPWGMRTSGRTISDANEAGAWIRYMFKKPRDTGRDIIVESLFMRTTQDEVIVRLPKGTDLEPILGEHRWTEFDLRPVDKVGKTSHIFQYNYRMNGDPNNHNWTEYFPTSKTPSSTYPVIVPYPRAHWADPSKFVHLRSLALPLKRARTPTPPPAPVITEPEVANNQQDDGEGGDTSRNGGDSHAIVKAEPVETNMENIVVKKMDPYEEEEASFNLLRSSASIKQEPSDIASAVMSLPQGGHNIQTNVSIKSEQLLERLPGSSSAANTPVKEEPQEYRPSQTLVDSLVNLHHDRQSRPVHPAQKRPSPAGDDLQRLRFKKVKKEYPDV